MSINFAQIASYISSNPIVSLVLSFIIGALVSYIVIMSKQRKESLDRKKLESYVKGINYIIEDETDKAIKELTETAKIDPDMIDIYVSIGNLFRKKGEINRALIIHKSLLARQNLDKNKKLDIYLNVGIDYRKAGLYDRAKKYFKDALSIAPKNQLAKKLLYEVYEDSKDWENALIWHKRFDGTDKHILAHLYTELGKEKLKEGNTEEAKKNFERAIKEYRECFDALINLGDIYFHYGKFEKAYELWEKACRIRPELCDIALNRIKDDNILREKIKQLLIEMPENEFIKFFSAENYLKLGEVNKAESLYRSLLKKRVHSLSILKRLVEINRDSPEYVRLFVVNTQSTAIKYTCTNCGYSSGKPFFRCPKCKSWDKLKVSLE